jgi:hypothetical protein
VDAIALQALEHHGGRVRPEDARGIDASVGSKAEVDARVAAREVARLSAHDAKLAPAPRLEFDARAERRTPVLVAHVQDHPVTGAILLVAQHTRAAIERRDDEVEISVAVDITTAKTA